MRQTNRWLQALLVWLFLSLTGTVVFAQDSGTADPDPGTDAATSAPGTEEETEEDATSYPAFWEDYGASSYSYGHYYDYGPFEYQLFPETLYGGSAYSGAPLGDSWTAHPSLLLRAEYYDNLTLANDAAAPIETWAFIISPGIRLETSNSKTSFSIGYQFTGGEYFDSAIDDFTAHLVRADFIHVPTDRSALYLYAAWEKSRDPRGTGRTEGPLQNPNLPPDEWESSLLGGRLSYGNKLRLELEADYLERDYTNNREHTRFYDREQWGYGLALFYAVSPRTSIMGRVRRTEFDYKISDPNRDSEETLYAIGAVYQASARTGFRGEIGIVDKDFEDPAIGSFDNINWWSVGLTWAPKTYSIFDVSFNRNTEETRNLGAFIIAETLAASWTHGWRPRITTVFDIQAGNYDYVDSGLELGLPFNRDDDSRSAGVRLNYQFRRTLFFGLGYRYLENDSNLPEFDYTANTFFIELFGAL